MDFNIEGRLHKLIRLSYHYISRFLFKEDLLTFSLHLIHNMYPDLFQHNVIINLCPSYLITNTFLNILILKY